MANDKPKIEIFRCCTHTDGTYLGDPMVHDPDEQGDGPWYLAIIFADHRVEFGFGTRQAALDALGALTCPHLSECDVEIAPWDDANSGESLRNKDGL